MVRRVENGQNEAIYHTFDDRLVSREIIESVIHQVEARQRRHEFLERARAWLLLGLVVALAAAVTFVLWWHLL
jgi:hypothetical protein